MDYKSSGVDIEAGYKSVELMKASIAETMRSEVLGGIGGFAGAFDLSKVKDMDDPVLLSGTDGCGTKVKLAFVMDKHDNQFFIKNHTIIRIRNLINFSNAFTKFIFFRRIIIFFDYIFYIFIW